MCQSATYGQKGTRLSGSVSIAVALTATSLLWGQAPAPQPDWRHIGNSAVELALASPASGPVARIWYSNTGERLFARTADGRVFETADFEKWQPSKAAVPPEPARSGANGREVVASVTNPQRLYAWSGQVLRSDDGGGTWIDLTGVDRRSILGGDVRDLAISPREPDEVVVANDRGVWRSLDGGSSWSGLNDALPNLPGARISSLPQGADGVRLDAGDLGAIEWPAGEKRAWRLVADRRVAEDQAARTQLSATLGATVTALAASGDISYAGSADGRLWASFDKGRNWVPSAGAERGPVQAIWTDANDPRVAIAVLGRTSGGAAGSRVLRTVNAGQFWDDLTGDLPEGSVNGVTADRASGAVYVATDRSVFVAYADLNSAGPGGPWTALPGLPQGRVLDVKLDAGGNQLFVVAEGYGVYATLAPHRAGRLRLVNAADFSERPAAPGSLVSVLGGRVTAARASGLNFPVLAASATETQLQVPFSAQGPSVALALETAGGSKQVSVPIATVSPSIFIDRDGTPLLLDGDTGVLLDAMNTAHSNSRLQILATGLGRVRPEWPAGVAGPAKDAPEVVTSVRAYLDRAPVEVTRAVLAPGYVGLYLIEVQLPALVNAGPAELYIEQENRQSNRVRVWLEP